ncbi:peptidoglycan-binding protein [Ponticoccus alexandrii]|uniref:Peptidoglycan-binding protein n=1 Tax=Ponticoccus alexandrii TaxID=1943633 RepID=A0ABX7F5J4_9RHOB|nr:peptidoglycan-binding protein [Ponticoccus alexandrii]QRF65384.1 peptidoglycan-binding protein [Ponticoccus alexandrii]
MRIPTLAAMALIAASPALAEGDALVIGNSRYSAMQTLFGAARVAASAQAMRDKGFDVAEVQDADAPAMREAFGDFAEMLAEDEGGPVVIVLAGAFLHGTGGAYLLPVEGDGAIDEAEVLTEAFPLDAALSVLEQYPGRAFLILGESAAEPEVGPWLRLGAGDLDIPQGVTVLRGPAADVARYAARDLARAGRLLPRAAAEYALTLEGYAPQDLVIVQPEEAGAPQGATEPPLPDPEAPEAAAPKPEEPVAEAPEPAPEPEAPAVDPEDELAWNLAQGADTAEGYDAYLSRFPEGAFASAARQRLKAIEDEPFYQQRRAEEQLELDREARRGVQRDLTMLGFDTRGIDGIFGPGTRGAIEAWQEGEGIEASGYLTAAQIATIDTRAAARAAELEREAEQRQAELERQDRLFWGDMQGRGDEASIRAYLERFPDGAFVEDARALLRGIERQREERAAASDRRAWERAEAGGTVEAYRDYLETFPGGAFAAEAESRVRRLEQESGRVQDVAVARQEEAELNLNAAAKRLAEARLSQLGLPVGEVDGRFDEDTRRALRRYQETRGLRVSGYFDEQTVVRLLADGVLGND